MKISPTTETSYNYPKTALSKKTNNNSFQGYVNGKFFEDKIISEAKRALKNPKWKEELLSRKRDFAESITTWHQREGQNDIASRVIMGVMTLGLTEISWGLITRVSDIVENKEIDEKIKNIEDCIEQLKK